jgi:hypothetical protein
VNREARGRSFGGFALRALCLCVWALLLGLAPVDPAISLTQTRGAFDSTGGVAKPSGGVFAEDLVVIHERPGKKLLVTRKIGPRVYCSVDCSVEAVIRLDLPGKKDPRAVTFSSNLIANRIYTATISPAASVRARLVRSIGSSKLFVRITATDQADRSDSDKRLFRFRSTH